MAEFQKAERGDLMLFTVTHSVTYAKGGTERSQGFELGLVASVKRSGEVGAYRAVQPDASGFYGYLHKGRPSQLWLISKRKIKVNDAVNAYAKRHDWNREFKTIDEAKEFLKRFLI